MTVYIAAPFPLRPEAIALMAFLEARGMPVTSRWLRDEDLPESADSAWKDIADVREADVLLAYNPAGWEEQGTGGRHFELGYAYAIGKPVVVLGVRSHIFHNLPEMRVFAALDDAGRCLDQIRHETEPASAVTDAPTTGHVVTPLTQGSDRR